MVVQLLAGSRLGFLTYVRTYIHTHTSQIDTSSTSRVKLGSQSQTSSHWVSLVSTKRKKGKERGGGQTDKQTADSYNDKLKI